MEKTLEQEFAEYREHHMYEMSVSALIKFENRGIYNHKLLKDYKNLDLTGNEKAFYIIDDLYDKYVENDDKSYIKVYKMLWNKIRHEIADDKSYRIDVQYDG